MVSFDYVCRRPLLFGAVHSRCVFTVGAKQPYVTDTSVYISHWRRLPRGHGEQNAQKYIYTNEVLTFVLIITVFAVRLQLWKLLLTPLHSHQSPREVTQKETGPTVSALPDILPLSLGLCNIFSSNSKRTFRSFKTIVRLHVGCESSCQFHTSGEEKLLQLINGEDTGRLNYCVYS